MVDTKGKNMHIVKEKQNVRGTQNTNFLGSAIEYIEIVVKG